MLLSTSELTTAKNLYLKGQPHSLMATSKETGLPCSIRHADGRNLYLHVSATGAMSWVFMYVVNGTRREMGLGSFTGAGRAAAPLTLRQARDKADLIRAQLQQPGVDLVRDRRVAKAEAAVTFEVMMAVHIEACKKGVWKKPEAEAKHWLGMLTVNAQPLMKLPVDKIETTDIVKAVAPKWPSRVAEKTVERIRMILDTAKSRGHLKDKDNPANKAAIKGHLKGKVNTQNRAALPAKDMPGFMAALLAGGSMAELGLAFIGLTAVRSTEAREALRSEIDFETGRWTIPAERMKEGERPAGELPHVVPLSRQALALIDRLPVVPGNPYLFPGKGSGPLRTTAFDNVIADMDLRGKTTVHGLRTTFRDYMGELHNPVTGAAVYDHQSLEFCLAHVLSGTEAAYRRQKSVDGRAIIMQVWADYATGEKPADNVVPIRGMA